MFTSCETRHALECSTFSLTSLLQATWDCRQLAVNDVALSVVQFQIFELQFIIYLSMESGILVCENAQNRVNNKDMKVQWHVRICSRKLSATGDRLPHL
jgi:hypothetical protein